MQLVRRYPRAGGIVLVIVGVYMAWDSLVTGKEMARFKGGSAVEGRVVGIENVGTTIPRFEMTVTWSDAVEERTAKTRVYKYESESLSPDETVELLVAKDDPEVVMLRRIYDNQGSVTLGADTQATPLIFFGALLTLGGGFLMATGARFLRAP